MTDDIADIVLTSDYRTNDQSIRIEALKLVVSLYWDSAETAEELIAMAGKLAIYIETGRR